MDTTKRALLDLDALRRAVDRVPVPYREASPFPHIVIDDFMPRAVAESVADEFPAVGAAQWLPFVHVNERKYAHNVAAEWGPTSQAILAELQGPAFLSLLTELTGIEQLLSDDSLEGGGLHLTGPGGHLNIHADFTVHPKRRQWRRRINLLWYLNREWPARYGGELELWSTDMKRLVRKVAPVFNRALIFSTDATSYHGHPDPLRCPEGEARRSLALYYFTEESEPLVRATDYRARPGDGLRAVPIYLDKTVLRAYDAMRRRLPVSDKTASRILGRIDRSRKRPRP